MASDAQGSQARLCFEPGAAPHTFDTSSEPYDFLYEGLRKQGRIVGGRGIRGTRSRSVERTRQGAYPVGGRIAFNISPAELDLWLPRMLGGTESANSFPLAEALPSFGILADRITQTFEYKDCMVDRWMIHGKAGPGDGEPDLLELVLDILAKDEVTGTTYPSLTLGTASGFHPYVMSDCSTLTLSGSSTRFMKEFWVVGNNFVQTRWVHSITANRMSPRDRLINFRCIVPYDTDHSNLYGQAYAGAAATLTFTNSATSKSTSFAFGTLQVPDNSPTVQGKQEIDLVLEGTALQVTTTKELVVTNVS